MQKLNSRLQIPRDNYILRVVGQSFAPSKSSGNPMISLEFEIVSPETVSIGGEEVMVSGTKLSNYYPTVVFADDGEVDTEKTAKAQARVTDLFDKFGLDTTNINFQNPALDFKGKVVHALLYSEDKPQRKAPTPEQIAKGQRVGDIIKNPVTGKDVTVYNPKISEIYGIATAEAGQNW